MTEPSSTPGTGPSARPAAGLDASDGLPQPDADALVGALRAEDAAVYAYGAVTAFAKPDRRPGIRADAAAHRARREAVTAALSSAGHALPEAASGYTVPFPVDDPASAARLTVVAEEDCAAAWYSVLERAQAPSTRSFAAAALADCAVRAAGWRTALGSEPPTVAFPGRPLDPDPGP